MRKKGNNKLTIVLGITGSIAAYKSCDIASTLTQAGCRVIPVLTQAAARFITPLGLQAITGNPCYTDMFEPKDIAAWEMHHISLAEQADILVIAPASADIIARAAQGRASDLLSSIILSTNAPVLFAPAMNVNMYAHPLTRKNIKTLTGIGYQFIGPEKGRLACGVEGLGRMSKPADIIERIHHMQHSFP
ncbi:MAG: flavoprotein [bacterium]